MAISKELYLRDCVMQLIPINAFLTHICHSVTVRYSPCVITQYMTLLAIRVPVAQWLERPTSVWKVMGSIPIWSSDFF